MMIAQTEQRSAFMVNCSRKLAAMPLDSMRIGFFLFALMLYALAGMPTPDGIGSIEAAIGGLLLLAVIRPELSLLWRTPIQGRASWQVYGRLALFFGLSVPLLAGVLHGNSAALIVRDMIWLGFLALPVLLAGLITARSVKALVFLCVLAGIILSLREMLGILSGVNVTAYIGNSPLVLFAAIMLAGYGVAAMMEKPFGRALGLGAGALLVMLSLIPLGAMVIVMQRASVGLFAVALALIFFAALRCHPSRTWPYLALVIGALLFFWQDLGMIGGALADKTSLVGFNRRAEEWMAVWEHINAHPLGTLFGTGWGGVYHSPAVGGMSVNFTHGALSSVLLKTGIAGVFVFGLYFYALGRKIWGNFLHAISLRGLIFALALLCPFLIDIFLYASFKSFDFGVLLALMAFAPKLLAPQEQQILVSKEKSL